MNNQFKTNKVDLSKIDLKKEREKITDLPGLIAFAHHVGSALIRPEDKGQIKGQAMAAMRDQTDRQFKIVVDQMKGLMEQAQQIKDRIEISERIYLADMNFKPVVFELYYLYRRADGTDVLSMIGPKEWGKRFPFEAYVAAVKLLSDHTWDVLDQGDISLA